MMWAALTGSIFLYFILVRFGFIAAPEPGTVEKPVSEGGLSLPVILTGIGLVNAVASMAIRMIVKNVRDQQGRRVTPAWIFPAFIAALALAESPAIFGFILGLQGEDQKSMMLLFGVSLVAMLANNPASFFAKADDDD
jgi:hypothetical protein